MESSNAFRTIDHEVDVCVVGGGLSGVCVALAAARRGAKTLIMQDRPVFGGNASREVRLHIAGAQERFTRHPDWNWKELRETGIIEELRLANQRYNPQSSWPVWDGILYDKIRTQDNLSFLLNCACIDATMTDDRITSIRGWQTLNQTYHSVAASVFVDCSGDSVLAPLTNAEYRYGREARAEFGESHAPEVADTATMGMTLLFEARDWGRPVPFTPPAWAKVLDESDLPNRKHDFIQCGYAWIEYGGEDDTIHESDRIREELLSYVYGVWDHIKNRGDHGADNWALDWIQFLPGKRETRRLMGDYIMRQTDTEKPNEFSDVVAYGGWSMDAHSVKGILYTGKHTTNHWTYGPFGIPYRSLYSRNVGNLMFAGRNISATHMAMTATRVQATCSIVGQAVGVAAATAVTTQSSPREVGQRHIAAVQQMLLEDNCYLPRVTMAMPELTRMARIEVSDGDPSVLRNGVDRPVDDESNAWVGPVGAWISFTLDDAKHVDHVRLVCDSDLNCIIRMNAWEPPIEGLPPTLLRKFRVEVRRMANDSWTHYTEVVDNLDRLIRVPIGEQVSGVRVLLDATWGAPQVRLFAVTLHDYSSSGINPDLKAIPHKDLVAASAQT